MKNLTEPFVILLLLLFSITNAGFGQTASLQTNHSQSSNINDANIYTGVTNPSSPRAILFFDDFESGTSQWTLDSTWNTTSAQSVSPSNSLTESPGGDYENYLNISATMVNGVDLTNEISAEVSFWTKYDIEVGLEFDNMYLEATKDDTNWIQLASFEGEGVPWTEFSYDLDGFLGNPDVKIRFRFFSDAAYEVDGMYIDDFQISTSDQDQSPPLIVHTGPEFYEGTPDSFDVVASINDISGVLSAEVQYKVNGGATQYLSPSSVVGDTYTFTIPEQLGGSYVDYWIYATDSLSNTTSAPPMNSYISGAYVAYDDPMGISTKAVSAGNGVAVRMTAPVGEDILVTALIRNYTDYTHPNDDFEFHVWSDNAGLPDTNIITPFTVTPEATLEITSPMTRVDLRAYSAQLSNITGDFHVGFTVPSGTTNITRISSGSTNRASTWNGSQWTQETEDYHFRVIMSNDVQFPVELISFTAIQLGASIKLDWSTATEVNNYGFDIERNTPLNPLSRGEDEDRGVWDLIGFMQGHGNSNSQKQYSFIDDTPPFGKIQYRLKQIDTDGTFEYSDVVDVVIAQPKKFELSQNYPNPFNPVTKISYTIPNSSFVTLKVYNILGNEIATLVNEQKSAGYYQIEFDGGNIASGVYFYTIRTKNFTRTRKFILLK